MRDYEVVYIFRPDLESEEVDERLEGYHERLADGEVTAVEHWGQRQLAYEIEDERKGYYVVVQFRAEPASLTDFEQGLRHDEDLIRHLVVLSEGELPVPPSQRREDEEEEEAEEEQADEGDEAEVGDEDEEDEDGADDEDEEHEDEDEEPAEDQGDAGDEDEEASEDAADEDEEE